MRILPFIISTVITAGLVFALNKNWGTIPPMGKFLSPQHGFWQNAEPADKDYSADLKLTGLTGKAEVYFDDRLVPHVFAENDNDAYFIQGYLHAKFRLWQMEFQTLATAGRISEIVGSRAINYDREQRRMGLTFAAENMVKAIEENETTRSAVHSYTDGVNAFIDNMKESELPIEYKLLNYKPERWSVLKTALFVKQVTKTLSGYGYSNDLQYSSLRSVFTDREIQLLFPYSQDSLSPIIPKGTPFPAASATAIKPPLADSVYIGSKDSIKVGETDKPTPGIGSNNWAVSGSKTKSGAPILCNDPHLELTLPSIWYEIQLHTPTHNAYGVSFPGLPCVVIGFNDSIAFGFTNGGIDVMDFYEIKFRDNTQKQYWFNGNWKDCDSIRLETIKVKGAPTVYDTVSYTVFGPVIYDKSFTSVAVPGKAIAVHWKAHDKSNELLTWLKLNRASNYNDYVNALPSFTCPVQNVAFASKGGDIAIWQQGEVPLRWARQGVYVMPGEDSSYMWQGRIPQEENPHILNPERGFISSANQRAVDSAYPYYVPGDFAVYRGKRINDLLSSMNQVTVADMMRAQNDNYNTLASIIRPVLLRHIDQTKLDGDEKQLLQTLASWNLINDPDEKGPGIFESWLDTLRTNTWSDDFSRVKDPIMPDRSTLCDMLLHDSVFAYADNINTPQKETVSDLVTNSFKTAAKFLIERNRTEGLSWSAYKNTSIFHLLRTATLPFARTGINNGGGVEILNATRHTNGPSWRMVVELTTPVNAYGVFPGGQDGNPGSRFYDNFLDNWANGKYFKLWFMREGDKTDKKVMWVMKFEKG